MPALICLDFDGVIHSYKSGWKGAHVIPDDPVPGAIEAILGYLNAGGLEVAIHSSRSKSLRGRRAMKRWLAKAMTEYFWDKNRPTKEWTILDVEAEYWGDAWAIVTKRIKWPWFKPAAFITIDDRALTFSGNWSDYTPDRVRAFQPWMKKAAA